MRAFNAHICERSSAFNGLLLVVTEVCRLPLLRSHVDCERREATLGGVPRDAAR
jgi:hypothetical protein